MSSELGLQSRVRRSVSAELGAEVNECRVGFAALVHEIDEFRIHEFRLRF